MAGNQFRLLVVDDDNLVIQTMKMALPEQWYLRGVNSIEEIPSNESFDAAFVDMHLTGDITKPEGIKVLEKLVVEFPHTELVAMSGNLDREIMEKCLKAGATRFLAKPLSKEEVVLVLDKIEALILLKAASTRSNHTTTPWIGESQASQDIKRQLADLKGESGPILIEGESGTGKEVAAKLLHSHDSGRPFITVNAAAIPETVFESEFFGHVKGAFTGADQNKIGLAEAAHEGDLFIDEIEALPLSQQAKLLRFLESGEIRRVGAKDSIRVKVRLIAATNRNLEQMVEKEQFREDLLWRISGKKLLLPPLRTRKDDVTMLCQHFLDMERPKRNKQLAEDAMLALSRYDWPGNVRELKRVIERLGISAPLPIIRAEDVNKIINPSLTPNTNNQSSDIDLYLGLSTLMANYEKQIVEMTLEKQRDVDEAAKILQISRSSLYKKIKDHGLG
ncbi:MAG: sigma-54 dependent transcriptional regulator [Bdellovibrionota bacterium]|nr:sigma-54 dependent transcriptional regulator [Bdellovibrionota bacterium]